MKKIVCTAVSALALAAFADGVNSTEFGVLQVPSSTTNTIVSVPWIKSGTGTADVQVKDLVLTAGLTDGDTIQLYNSSTKEYTATWTLENGQWTGGTIVTEDEIIDSGSDETGIPLGSAFKLNRTTTDQEKLKKGFYIMGKPTDTGVTITLGEGYSLIAPPSTGNTDINTGITWTGIAAGDKIMVPSTDAEDSSVTLSYVDTTGGENRAWKKWDRSSKAWVNPDPIKAGTGVWFVNSGSGTKTFKLK